jgi:hypothetical protein
MMTNNQIINQTKHWLNSFVISYNICPFAYKSFINNSIHYEVNESSLIENCLLTVFSECQHLDASSDIDTSLLIFPNPFNHFDNFLHFLSLSEELLSNYNYDGIYQLASFHPLYLFENEVANDPANYTNRSPYPMLHLIRESSITAALVNFPHPQLIPINNIKLTRKLGTNKLQNILDTSLYQ